jgi:hypothetical protein
MLSICYVSWRRNNLKNYYQRMVEKLPGKLPSTHGGETTGKTSINEWRRIFPENYHQRMSGKLASMHGGETTWKIIINAWWRNYLKT